MTWQGGNVRVRIHVKSRLALVSQVPTFRSRLLSFCTRTVGVFVRNRMSDQAGLKVEGGRARLFSELSTCPCRQRSGGECCSKAPDKLTHAKFSERNQCRKLEVDSSTRERSIDVLAALHKHSQPVLLVCLVRRTMDGGSVNIEFAVVAVRVTVPGAVVDHIVCSCCCCSARVYVSHVCRQVRTTDARIAVATGSPKTQRTVQPPRSVVAAQSTNCCSQISEVRPRFWETNKKHSLSDSTGVSMLRAPVHREARLHHCTRVRKHGKRLH